MRALRQWLVVGCVAVSGVSLAACGGSSGDDGGGSAKGSDDAPAVKGGKNSVGVVAIDLQNSFFVNMKKAGDQAAKDYGISTTWQSAEGSLEKQISIIENMVRQKVGAILLDPVDAKGVGPSIRKAVAAGVPVVTMGNKVDGGGNYNTLYPDTVNAGTMAKVLGQAVGGKGQVGILVGSRGNYVSDTREKGFVDGMKQAYPGVKVIAEPTDFDTAKATDVMTTWLTTYPDLAGFACISDSLCLAAQSAAQDAGKTLPFVGNDGDEAMHPLLEAGQMKVDVLTGAQRVGYWNVAVGARLAKGAKLPKDLFMPTYFIAGKSTIGTLGKLNVKAIDTATAKKTANGYSAEFGPKKPDTAMTVGQ